jgi:WD40 repeat protein
VALGIALVVALVIGVVAVRQRDTATRERRIATARELAAAATANLDVDPERSVLLALAAVDRSRSGDGSALPEATQALHDAVTASRATLHVPGVGGAVAWSPDGVRFAAAGPAGTVAIHDAATGEPVQTIAAHDERVNGIAFSPDGALLGTTAEDGDAKVWDLETGDVLHSLQSPLGRDSLAPSFSPDGALFAASWWNEGLIRIVDVATGQVVREIRAPGGGRRPRSTAFDPSGARIVVALEEGTTVVVDVRTGEEVMDLQVPASASAAWSPDGSSIATAGGDGSARIFDARTGRQRFALRGHRARVNDVDWSPDSRRIVTASDDGSARVWGVAGVEGLELFTLSAQDTRAGLIRAAFSPDGSQVVTGDIENRATIVWQASRGGDAELANLPAVTFGESLAAHTPDGRYLLVGNAAGGLTVWDAESFTIVRTLGPPAAPTGAPLPNGDFLDAPTATGTWVSALDVSPDGRLVAAAVLETNETPIPGSSLRIWDVETGAEAFRVRHRGIVDDIAWSPDGNLLAISTADVTVDAAGDFASTQQRLAVVDRSGREVAALPDEEEGVQILSLAFTRDGERLIGVRSFSAVFDADFGQVAIWDWRAERLERTIDTGGEKAVLSPDEDLLVSTPSDYFTGSQVAEVWDWDTGEHLRTLAGNSGSVTRAAFSPDGSRLATASKDGTVRIWDPRTGEQQLDLHGHAGHVTSITFSPDGSRLASVGADGVARVWALDLDDLVDVAERGLTRTLTDDECRQYLHAQRCP